MQPTCQSQSHANDQQEHVPAGALDGVDFSDSQSSTSEGSSDDGSSQDSVSSASSVYSVSADSVTNFGSGDCSYQSSIVHTTNSTVEPVPNWLENVNNLVTKVVPADQRQNPRRTCPANTAGEAKAPPTLIRQSERKDCFVAILVGFAAQFVEAIWPLAACTPRTDTCFFGRGVLPLRTFITETLRRSRTSYSTLQVALFYLVLIKDMVPKTTFCSEQPRAGDEFRSMQCGRRMFLTALILASKYLQDRNYSTRAWSKISGLRAQEIHVNEMNYCKVIDWNLHITQEKFQRWSRIVLNLSRPTSGSASETVAQRIGWPKVLGKLNKDLTEDFEQMTELPKVCGLSSLPLNTNFSFGDATSEKQGVEQYQGLYSRDSTLSQQNGSEGSDPSPNAVSQPPLPIIHNLPTPQSTPQTQQFGTFSGSGSTSAMSATMCQLRQNALARASLESCPPPQPYIPRCNESRPSSLSRSTTQTYSPPESVLSDVPTAYSRRSRSSSISSMASSVSVASLPSKHDRITLQRSTGLGDTRYNPVDTSLTKTWSNPDCPVTRYNSPQLYGEIQTSPASAASISPQRQAYMVRGPTTLGLQDLEAAAALCKLRPMAESYNEQFSSGQAHNSATSSWQSTPNARYLNGINGAAPSSHPSAEATPTASSVRYLQEENVSPSRCHKRTHSKATDTLQDEVRAQLRNSLWTSEITDRTIKAGSSPRHCPIQSPTMTYGVTKTAVPVKGTDGGKRHCMYEVSAADRASRMLRKSMVRPIR